MSKLWHKGHPLHALMEKFCTGEDPILDKELIYYDCVGTIAHATMLTHIGILNTQDLVLIKKNLLAIIENNKDSALTIPAQLEDVHTFIENKLTEELGDLGKKVHTARSRNDQVILDLRLYTRDQIMNIMSELLELCTALHAFAQTHQHVPYAGRTHFQPAMVSSLGLWAGAFAESLLDNIFLLLNSFDLINKNPLGSAASYGVALPLDRTLVAQLLGFDSVQNNVLYVNNSRGKFESVILSNLAQIMIDLSKLSTDVILFSTPEFGYFNLPEEFCFGSSLMPQKRNPCPLELTRAKSATVISYLFVTLEIIRALPSGYNRDFQETKKPFMQGFQTTLQSIQVCTVILKHLTVNNEKCLQSITPELFATDYALELAQQGMPFRDAYLKVAQNLGTLSTRDPLENIKSKTHEGTLGNLGLDMVADRIKEYKNIALTKHDKYQIALNTLLKE